ncbi:MAG: winged helix-turn-helix domain-containing protein [Burkholderiales bacterium]
MNIECSFALPAADGAAWPVATTTWVLSTRLPDPLPTPSLIGARPARAPVRTTRPASLRIAVRFAGWELDLVERLLVAPGGGTVRLPGMEFALLQILVMRPHQTLARDDLARQLTRDRGTRLSGRTVDSYVSRLRRRFALGGAEELIRTVRSSGYCFTADVVRA